MENKVLIGKACYACGSNDVVSLYGIFPICGICLENANEEYQGSLKQDKERGSMTRGEHE